MDGRTLGYGAVAGLEGIATPAAVARQVHGKIRTRPPRR
jgi:isoaspartyl peptidase/L-asparaginase-like protein (Ntn-hydrolase superfamily)